MANDPSPFKLLLVDDDPLIVELVSVRLQSTGYTVKTASNGLEAKNLIETEPFHLVVCDIVMPEMDGLTLCRRLREEGRDVHFLFLTAKGRPQDIVQVLASGADDYVIKPFQAGELVARIRALLRRLYPA